MQRTWFWRSLASSLAVLALWPAAATATVTEAQVQESVGRAVTWFRAKQESDGALGLSGGLDPAWALLGLAGAGVNAADLSAGPGEASAQEYYLGLWSGPNDKAWTSTGTPQASDYERVIMLAKAAGLDPLRLSAQQNLLAKLAGFYRSKGLFGPNGSFNQTMFALIALDQVLVPAWLIEQVAQTIEGNAHEDGGWTYSTVASQTAYERPGEVDLTGAAIAGLCGADRTASSPAVAKAISFLEGERASNGSLGDVDSTSWALDGLGACGVKRGSTGWTPGDERTLEWLLEAQLSTGENAGAWEYGGSANFYATQDALRAIDAPGFDVEPPPRANPSEPARRQPLTVAAGTEVPVVLAIDAGLGDIRLCSTTAPAGASLSEVLAAAQAQSSPEGCVGELQAGAEGVGSLNGAVPVAGSGGGWMLSLEGGAERAAEDQTVGFGEVLGLRLEDPSPLGVSASRLQFEPRQVGEESDQLELKLVNRESTAIEVQAPQIAGAAAADFRIVSQDCAGRALGSGESCVVSVSFTPSALGARDAVLEAPVEGQGAIAVALDGEGASPPEHPGGSGSQSETPGSGQGGGSGTGAAGSGGAGSGATGETTTSSNPSTTSGETHFMLVRVLGLDAARLLLKATSAGTITVRIADRADPGKNRRWQTVKTMTVRVARAGEVKVKLPHLAPGRYRMTIASPEGTVVRVLWIRKPTAKRRGSPKKELG